MRISHYQFGRMVVDERTYSTDLIIQGLKVMPEWWRSQGHRLDMGDLAWVQFSGVTDLIVGTGYYGRMVVSSSVVRYCREHDINLKTLRTSHAVEIFNILATEKPNVVGAFHLTC